MATQQEGGGAAVAEQQDDKERSCGDKTRDCGLQFMDCMASFGRGTVTAGRSCSTATSHAVYPVKERLVKTKDACMVYFHPHTEKTPVGPEVPRFRHGTEALADKGGRLDKEGGVKD
uniref:Uncharacterized protein n=1 Tax=Alexandrium monilatum TaxID=311494 RepID=A0A7S4V9C1_9DINO|mmetsp:Transcript_66146/g.196875  ORF Transcript_66146/g.196875 Transcript_66146/m.196875 type:complete len:117 (-) Transcript_66146:19-369(-)